MVEGCGNMVIYEGGPHITLRIKGHMNGQEKPKDSERKNFPYSLINNEKFKNEGTDDRTGS